MKLNLLSIFFFFLFSLILSILIYTISYILIKQNNNLEKLSAYECGFNPYGNARKIFDVKFYLIAILFIVFDLEIVYIFPWALTLSEINSTGFWVMIEFLIELIVGYFYVWCSLALEWD